MVTQCLSLKDNHIDMKAIPWSIQEARVSIALHLWVWCHPSEHCRRAQWPETSSGGLLTAQKSVLPSAAATWTRQPQLLWCGQEMEAFVGVKKKRGPLGNQTWGPGMVDGLQCAKLSHSKNCPTQPSNALLEIDLGEKIVYSYWA